MTSGKPTFQNRLKDRETWLILLELVLIAAAAIWLGRPYLNLDDTIYPSGVEFHWVIQTHHFWTWVRECGLCAFWNGSERGGFPAFIDLQGAILHPVIILTTWLWGVVNGAKITIPIAFWIAGMAQWWLGREFRLGRIARLWSALIATVGTHLAARMEMAWLGVILSAATSALIFPAVLRLERKGDNRSMVIFAAVLALTIVSGQGYAQIGLIFASPAFLLLFFTDEKKIDPSWYKLILAGLLAVLLTAVLLVPVAHFIPDFTKPGDPNFGAAQPFEYSVLNLVIRDQDFFRNGSLSKSFSAVYTAFYIGWTPVILAVLVLALKKKGDGRRLLFLASSAFLLLLTASGWPLKQLVDHFQFLMRIRGPMLITSIAVPPILLLAAYSVERILSKDLRLEFQMESAADPKPLRFNFKWLLLIPLVLNVRNVAVLSKDFIAINHQPPHIDTVLDAVKTDSLEWVQFPPNQWVYIETAIRRGYKLSPGIIPFDWKDREFPLPFYEVTTGPTEPPTGNTGQQVITDNYKLFEFDETREYARVEAGRQIFPCQAYGTGGDLDVFCDNPSEGLLVLQENSWSGWKVYRDGEQVELLPEQWLSARAPAGEHEYQFRYRLWDVPLGAAVSLLGIGLCVWLWFKKEEVSPVPRS